MIRPIVKCENEENIPMDALSPIICDTRAGINQCTSYRILSLVRGDGFEAIEGVVLEDEVALAGVLQPETVRSDEVEPPLHSLVILRDTHLRSLLNLHDQSLKSIECMWVLRLLLLREGGPQQKKKKNDKGSRRVSEEFKRGWGEGSGEEKERGDVILL